MKTSPSKKYRSPLNLGSASPIISTITFIFSLLKPISKDFFLLTFHFFESGFIPGNVVGTRNRNQAQPPQGLAWQRPVSRAPYIFRCRKKIGAKFFGKKNPEFFFGFENKSISEKCKTASFSFFFASLTKEKSLTLIRLKEKKKISESLILMQF